MEHSARKNADDAPHITDSISHEYTTAIHKNASSMLPRTVHTNANQTNYPNAIKSIIE